MPDSPPCEFVDVALHFQRMIRGRGSEPTSPETIEIGERCGRSSVGATRSHGGTSEHFCDLHLRQPKLVLG